MTGTLSPPAAFGWLMKGGVGIQPRRIPVSHYEHDAGRGLRFGRVDLGNAALRDRRIVQRCVEHARSSRELGGEPRLSGDLQRSIDARYRRADQAMLVANQRVGDAARDPADQARGRRPS